MITKERFNEVFKEHYPALKIYARRFVIDNYIAGDIVQDVFYNLWKMRDEFQPRDSMKSYLFSAVYYKCMNYIKHEKIKVRHDKPGINASEEFRSHYLNEISNFQESLLIEDSVSVLKAAISELPDQCRRVFLLSRKFGLKNREIADYLEISLKVVEKHISKALLILRNQLKTK